ncbi:ABC transporter ATP-binding protein [Segeticoccus rhizosphaerae]|jgi:iron(III) transport system ATP-binding protein|uniref:ABC transporter ATP-binding protein n=1 Tax=Segeticoccus rhizosphaerae TaxID=1104777 RepID=UPI0010BFEB4B|nr:MULTISPECIES: ABC transporter ATP-binding protein [Intrasporangiaceae]
MTGLTLRGVSKSFGGTPVLHEIDLEAPARSFTAVLGPSGCGKTTMLRLIAGFLTPDSGTISFDDRVVWGGGRNVPAQKRRVGYVPQEGALFPHLDVAANIGFGLPRATRREGRTVEELLALVGLAPSLRTRMPHELSGGQQQRVALARALAPSPSVVLLDEPFASLDTGLRAGTGRAVAEALREAEATAVLVTHDQGEALSLADQVAVMRDGRLVQADSPRAIYETPADEGVAQFLGASIVVDVSLDAADRHTGRASSPLGPVTLAGANGNTGRARALVRPEQIRLCERGQGVPALVTEVSYYGHDAAVRLTVEGDHRLRVTARVLGLSVPSPGETVGLEVTGGVTVFDPSH